MVPSNAASGYVAKISMLILATYPSANSPSWPPCPGMFGTLFGTFGTFGTSGTFGTFLDPGNIVRVQRSLNLQSIAPQSVCGTVTMFKSQIGGLALNRGKWPEMGPEWSPGPENRAPGMTRPFSRLWDLSRVPNLPKYGPNS